MELLEEYFTPAQLASQLNTSVRTLARWDVLRIGPPKVTVGRKILYRRDSVHKWLESREQRRGQR